MWEEGICIYDISGVLYNYFWLGIEAPAKMVTKNMVPTYERKKKGNYWGCLVHVFKQQFSVFKQHYTYFYTCFYLHVFLHIFSNNNFQFLNTCTK